MSQSRTRFLTPARDTPVTDRLRDIAVEQLRPIDALVLLTELVEMLRSPESDELA